MKPEYVQITQHILIALAAGGVIGYERSYSGRPAGFRTHALVCMASSLLMLVTVYQGLWFSGGPDVVRIDPTRMAQGIMTGIGFLGAGVIVKEGVSVRGLTTAASIWVTAAIGILCGAGFYFPAALGTVLVLGTLSVFRWIEGRMPALFYVHYAVRYAQMEPLPEPEFRALIAAHGFAVAEVGYHMSAAGHYFEYRGVIRTLHKKNLRLLAETLRKNPEVLEFRMAPTGD